MNERTAPGVMLLILPTLSETLTSAGSREENPPLPCTFESQVPFCKGIVASQVALMVKNLSANARDLREAGSIPRSRRSPGGGLSNPLQYSCLENPMDKGAWQAIVHRVAQSWTCLKQLGMYHLRRLNNRKLNILLQWSPYWSPCFQTPHTLISASYHSQSDLYSMFLSLSLYCLRSFTGSTSPISQS